jgi:hypothetical protein
MSEHGEGGMSKETGLGEGGMSKETGLDELVGAKLSAVTFVMDYVQLAFDGPTLNAYTWPTVHVGDRVVRRGDSSYRDELCGRIARQVIRARVNRDAIELAFSDDSMIRVSLRAEDLGDDTPEAAELRGREWLVFHPV